MTDGKCRIENVADSRSLDSSVRTDLLFAGSAERNGSAEPLILNFVLYLKKNYTVNYSLKKFYFLNPISHILIPNT